MTAMGKRVWGEESDKSKAMLQRIPQNKFVGKKLRTQDSAIFILFRQIKSKSTGTSKA